MSADWSAFAWGMIFSVALAVLVAAIYWTVAKPSNGHRHTFVPIYVDHGRYHSGGRWTGVHGMCACGKTRWRRVAGHWSVGELRNPSAVAGEKTTEGT